jgi:hypothetical protein
MKATMIAFALFLGLATAGTTLVPGGQAHAANTSWTNDNQGGGAG